MPYSPDDIGDGRPYSVHIVDCTIIHGIWCASLAAKRYDSGCPTVARKLHDDALSARADALQLMRRLTPTTDELTAISARLTELESAIETLASIPSRKPPARAGTRPVPRRANL